MRSLNGEDTSNQLIDLLAKAMVNMSVGPGMNANGPCVIYVTLTMSPVLLLTP